MGERISTDDRRPTEPSVRQQEEKIQRQLRREEISEFWRQRKGAERANASTHPRNNFQILVPRSPIRLLPEASIRVPDLMLFLRASLPRNINSFLLLVHHPNSRHCKLLESNVPLRVVSFDVEDLLPEMIGEDIGGCKVAS